MSTVIYYFSGTGNSLHAAKRMAEILDGETSSMSVDGEIICSSDVIGFVFPTYFWELPRTVEQFIKKLKITVAKPYLFAAATYGGIPGGAPGRVRELLEEKGLSLSYGASIPSVANFVEEYNLRKNSVDKKNLEMDRKAAEIAKRVLAGERNTVRPVRAGERLFYKLYTDVKMNRDEGFFADEKCSSCGVCTKICPNQNIRLEKGRPVFLHQCEHCDACIQWCPREAIQWKGRTQKRTRYHHPDITLKEMLNPLEKNS